MCCGDPDPACWDPERIQTYPGRRAIGCGCCYAAMGWLLMHDKTSVPVNAAQSGKRSFAAMRHGGFRAQFATFVLAMMADNIEHVISYWMVFQKFHSPALAGFAIVSHWLPFLLFSVSVAVWPTVSIRAASSSAACCCS